MYKCCKSKLRLSKAFFHFIKSFYSRKYHWGIVNLSLLHIVAFLILSILTLHSQMTLIQNEFKTFQFDSPKLSNYFSTDSMNQLQYNGLTRLVAEEIKINNIELYSKFDGGYALQFLPVFFNYNSNEKENPKITINHKSESLTTAALFTGSKNGFFQAFNSGRYRSFYWLINPYFEINNGIYYPDGENSFLNQNLVQNSSFQNISGRTEFGIKNEHSFLLMDFYLSFANLYTPTNLLYNSKIMRKFDNYNNILSQIKFSNSFSDDLKIYGVIFLKNFLRKYSTIVDSTIFSFDTYNKEFEIEEFNYGINSIIEYNSGIIKNPLEIKFSYIQDLFLINNNYLKSRSRIESENLKFGLQQNLNYSEQNTLGIKIYFDMRAILYSSLGNLPKNLHTLNASIDNLYNIDTGLTLTNSISRKQFLPFVSYYFKISDNYNGNTELIPETWYSWNNSAKFTVSKDLNIITFLNFYLGQNLIIFENSSYKFINNGTCRGVEIGLNSELLYSQILIKFDGSYNYQQVSDNNILISNFLMVPRFKFNVNIHHNFNNLFDLELNFKFQDGLHSIHPLTKEIHKINSNYIVNLLLQKQYDNTFFTLILRNLTNRYYETNIGLPDRGISFLLGTSMKF